MSSEISSSTYQPAAYKTDLLHVAAVVMSVSLVVVGVALIALHYLAGHPLLLPGTTLLGIGGGSTLAILFIYLRNKKEPLLQAEKTKLETENSECLIECMRSIKLIHGEIAQLKQQGAPFRASKEGMQVVEFILLPLGYDLNAIYVTAEDFIKLFPDCTEPTDQYVWIKDAIYKVNVSNRLRPGQVGINSFQLKMINENIDPVQHNVPLSLFIKPVVNSECKEAHIVWVDVNYISEEKVASTTEEKLKKIFMEELGSNPKLSVGRKIFYYTENGSIEFRIGRMGPDISSFFLRHVVCQITENAQIHFKAANTALTLTKEASYTPKQISESDAEKPAEMSYDLVEELAKAGIVGLPDSFNTIVDTISASFGHLKEEYKKRGMKPEKGMILYGPPGTGKTSIAKIIGKALGCSQQHITMHGCTELLSKYVGDTEAGIRNLFSATKEAEEKARQSGSESPLYVIILDEIDTLLSNRSFHKNSWETTHINEFLNQMDGLNQCNNFFVIGLTNRFEALDPAATRPGRFGTCVEIQLPTAEQRKCIFLSYLKPLIQQDCLDKLEDNSIHILVDAMRDFSGADIKGVVEHATKQSLRRLDEACKKNPSLDKKAVHPEGNVTFKDLQDGIHTTSQKKQVKVI